MTKQGFVFVLLITLTLFTNARSQTEVSDYLAHSPPRAGSGVASTPMPSGSVEEASALLAPEPEALGLASQLLREKDGLAFTWPEVRGGLWVSGDVDEGIARLRWIAGPENAELLHFGIKNQLTLNAA